VFCSDEKVSDRPAFSLSYTRFFSELHPLFL
jgi:hypothetical protein